MRIVLFLLVMRAALGQTNVEAARLLKDVADSASKAVNWRIEGSVEYSGPGPSATFGTSTRSQFTLLMRSPEEVHFEETNAPTPALIVCDGSNAWIYSPPINRYKKEPSAKNPLCSPIVGQWRLLTAALESPTLVGSCGPAPSIETPANYQLVSGFSMPEIAIAGRMARTLCIDPAKKLIVWETWKTKDSSRVYVYSKIDQNEEFAQDAFTFRPPPHSVAIETDLPTPRPLGTPAMAFHPDTTFPRVVSKQAPKYGNRSRKERIQGTVTLYVVVAANGLPTDALVYHPLSPDLDLEAVKAVQKWRFAPATRNGEPTEFAVLMEINFRLH